MWNKVNDTTRLHYAELRRFLLFGFGDAAGQVLSSYIYDAQKALGRGQVQAGIWKDIDAGPRRARCRWRRR